MFGHIIRSQGGEPVERCRYDVSCKNAKRFILRHRSRSNLRGTLSRCESSGNLFSYMILHGTLSRYESTGNLFSHVDSLKPFNREDRRDRVDDRVLLENNRLLFTEYSRVLYIPHDRKSSTVNHKVSRTADDFEEESEVSRKSIAIRFNRRSAYFAKMHALMTHFEGRLQMLHN